MENNIQQILNHIKKKLENKFAVYHFCGCEKWCNCWEDFWEQQFKEVNK